MDNNSPGKGTRALAAFSVKCLVCRRARSRQAGFAFWVVKTFEGICPFCRAYNKVHFRKSHEPIPVIESAPTAPEHHDHSKS
jgi:hypothetical protein